MLRLMDFGVFAAFDVEVSAGGETHVQEVLGMVPNEELGFDPGAAAADIVQVRLRSSRAPGRVIALQPGVSGGHHRMFVCTQPPHPGNLPGTSA